MPIRRTLALLLILGAPLAAQQPEEKMLDRYRQVLFANPIEGIAFDRLWKYYAEKGQTAQLIDEYRKPGTFSSEMVLGHLLRRAGRMDDARAAYEHAATLDAKNPLAPLSIGALAAATGKPRESAGWYEKAIPLFPPADPRLAETLMQLGTQWLALGDLAKATDAWERTVKEKPGDLELHRTLAETYTQHHVADRAIEHLDFLVAHAPPAERAQALQKIAHIRQGAGDQDGAIAALEKALALTTPGNWLRAELQSQLIRLHQRYHRTAELEERWKKYAAENPRDLNGYLQLADLYERLGDLEHERFWLERLTQLAPKNPEYRLRLARLLVQIEQIDPAIALYDALIAEQPSNPDYVFERARLDVQREQMSAARDRIAKLLELRKSDESIRGKALEFYEQNHLTELAEQHLAADAAAGGEDGVLALATFYFSQKREADALRTLQRLVDAKDPAPKQAAAHFKIAQTLKAQNLLDGAWSEAEKALALQPASREILIFKGETLSAQGRQTAAQDAFAKAVELSKTPAEQADADQKLFDSFRPPAAAALPTARSPGLLVTPGGEPLRIANPALDEYLAGLERRAAGKPDEAAWLRVARWRIWNRDSRGAQQALDRALALNPKSVVAYELAVKLSTLDGPSPAAVFQLTKLTEIDPANRVSYQRRAGQLELQAGRVNEALAIFSQILKESPGNLDALTDLALTQQRADRWPDALETWRQIYALSPAGKKRDAFTPLLRVLERLEMHAQAAELQLQAIDAETSQQQQFQLFGDLLAHCSRHGLVDWLRAQFETRRKVRADDYFTEMALGKILKVSGNKAAAFEVLADASYAAPNQAEALPELIREAEELRKLDAAIRLQGQLLRIVPQTQSDGFEKLAQLQEKNFELEDAAKTWDRAVARFPRDTAVLAHAVDFQVRWGTPARAVELLRRVRTLDPGNLRALATLADLSAEAGQHAEAAACLEQILARSTPEAAGEPLRFPGVKAEDPGRVQTAYLTAVSQRGGRSSPEAMRALRSFWVEDAPDAKGDRELRLNAILKLGEALRDGGDPAALKAWIERWRKSPAPTEALWALYAAGAGDELLDRVEKLMQTTPADARIAQAFIWLALQTGEFRRLGAWLQDRTRTPSERDYLLVALGRYATTEGSVDPALLDQLFPTGSNLRLWQIATLFATRNHFAEAIRLGERIVANASSQRANFARDLGHWQLTVGDVEKARASLLLACAGSGESFDSDVYGALRESWLLLPATERGAFAAGYLEAIDPARQPLHYAIAGAVLRALEGDEAGAKKHLAALLDLRALASLSNNDTATESVRRWRLVQIDGSQLQAWHFESLAAWFWERALADEALVSLQGDEAIETARDIRQRLYALRAAATRNAFDLQPWLDAYVRTAPRDGLLPLGEALDALGAARPAIEVYRRVCEGDPSNPQLLRSLLNACRAGGDDDAAEAALWKSIGEEVARGNDANRREQMLQLSDLLEHKGDLDRARTILSEAVENSPAEGRLLLRLAQLHERAKNPDLAEAVYRRLLTVEPGNGAGRVALATLLDSHGKGEAALALLQKGTGPEVDARLAQLQFQGGQVEDALATLERIPPPQHIAPTLAIVTALAERGDRRLARSVVQEALRRTADATLTFPLLSKAVELLQPSDGPASARRELRRLRMAADDQPGLLGSYLDFAQVQTARLGLVDEFVAELRKLWDGGAGPIAAGSVLAGVQAAGSSPATAEETLAQLLKREDAGEVWLYRLAGILETAGQPEQALRVREKMARSNPASEPLGIDWARALHRLGRTTDARAVLARLSLRSAISDDSAARIAPACAELGDRELAQQLFTQATRNDPYVRNSQLWLDLARFQLAGHDPAAARRTLRTAYSSPAARDFAPFVEWLSAAGRMDKAEADLAELSLTPTQMNAARSALFGRLAEGGQIPAAIALIEAHPEIASTKIAARLRELANSSQRFEEVATLFEGVTRQRPAADISAEWARLLGDWAAADVAAGRIDPALAHLRRAHELQPALYEVAQRLATLQSQNGSAKSAQETLESFLAATNDAAESAHAQELVARLKAGGTL